MASAAVNHNPAHYQRRLDFIRHQLPYSPHFNLEKADITPIEYDPECPFRYNNFVYRLTLPSPTTSEDNASKMPMQQPGCTAIPDGVTEFIVRLTNPDATGMNIENRVENEIALINLVGTALSNRSPKVVPSVYGWGSAAAKSSQGWILQEIMPGTPLDAALNNMDIQRKKTIFAQICEILREMQNYRLPPTIEGFGGLTFDSAGCIVSGPMTSVDSGSWSSYEESYKERLIIALAKADLNVYIRGWHANGVRERVDAFVESGLPAQFQYLDSKDQRVIIHADVTANNLLYDAASNRITALLDYDFACISHPSYEFFRSFDGAGGQFRGWSGDEVTEQLALRDAKLHGFPSPLPPQSKEGVDWELMAAWEDELAKAQVLRPSTIRGIEHVADVDAVLRAITPWRITNPDIMGLQSEEVKVRYREDSEKALIKILARLGF